MRRAITLLRSREQGFTLVEMMVTMLVMGIVASAVTAVALRTFTDTATITNRRDVFADGQIALDQLSKQLRQGESIDASSSATSIKFSSYIDGMPATIAWRVTGSASPYTLEESRDGGTTFAPVLAYLNSPSVFTYTSHGGVEDQVTITLSLGTTTSTVVVSSDVHLRNAQT